MHEAYSGKGYSEAAKLTFCSLSCVTRNRWASQVALVVKNLPANAGDVRVTGLILGAGRSPRGGHGNPLQYYCLENPTDRGAWRATVYEVTESQTWLERFSTQKHKDRVEHGPCAGLTIYHPFPMWVLLAIGLLFSKNIFCLHQALAVTYSIFYLHCSMQDLVVAYGIYKWPRSPVLGMWNFSH